MRVLVPVDGSAPSSRAVQHALALVRGRADGEILLLNVQGPRNFEVSDITAVMSVESDRAAARRQARKALRKAVRLCEEAGVRYEAASEMGLVAETIARRARSWHADQIIMGTRGLGALRRLILGSVAARVARLAAVPVTLVK